MTTVARPPDQPLVQHEARRDSGAKREGDWSREHRNRSGGALWNLRGINPPTRIHNASLAPTWPHADERPTCPQSYSPHPSGGFGRYRPPRDRIRPIVPCAWAAHDHEQSPWASTVPPPAALPSIGFAGAVLAGTYLAAITQFTYTDI